MNGALSTNVCGVCVARMTTTSPTKAIMPCTPGAKKTPCSSRYTVRPPICSVRTSGADATSATTSSKEPSSTHRPAALIRATWRSAGSLPPLVAPSGST